MTAFSFMIDDLFENPDLAEDAVYIASGTETSRSLRVIVLREDKIGDFGETKGRAQTILFEVRRSDVAAPVKGDKIVHGERNYVVQAPPKEEAGGELWVLNVREED